MKKLTIVLVVVSCALQGINVHGAEPKKQNTPKVDKILDRPLIPTGYGLTQLLKEDFYLGRFSIDASAVYRSAEDLVFIDAARRMEFKFVADRRISGRTFGRQLAESMKINNTNDALEDSMSNIKKFMGFFKRSIRKGDKIRFDYHKSFGTRVYHNKRLLGSIPYSLDFYRILLNIWLGDRPPSNQFKQGLLGQNGDQYAIELQTRFDSK